MIQIELFDGTVLEFPSGTDQAIVDRVAREETIARRSQAQKPDTEASQDRGFGEMLYENIIGQGDVDTPGERLGQFVRGGTAAVARGIADVPALPANLAQLATLGVEKALGIKDPSMVSRGLAALPDTREMLAAVPVIGPESEYVAPGTAGEYIATAGEFAGGAGAATGPASIMRYGLLPGVASEAAGQLTEGTAVEPYARTAAALATPFAANALQNRMQQLVSPMSGQIDPARARAVEELRAAGVTPTAGQIAGGRAAQNQLYREAATAQGRTLADEALEDFTAAALKSVGSTGRRATPEVLEEVDTRLGKVFDDAAAGVNVSPSMQALSKMSAALKTYREMTPSSTTAPIFKNINSELVKSFRSGTPIPASNVAAWRSTLSKLTRSPDPATRTAADEALDVVDDAIDAALISAGKPEIVDELSKARVQYRNLLAIEHAAQRAEGGILTPAQLRTALLMQGRRRYVQGRGDLGPLTRAGTEILKPLPQSGTQPRTLAQQVSAGAAGGTGAGLGALGLGLDPMAATAVGAAATAAPAIRNQFLSSPMGQRYFLNQLMSRAEPLSAGRAGAAMLPGVLSQYEEAP